jgi:hypothetical protein
LPPFPEKEKSRQKCHPGLLAISVDPSYKTVEKLPVYSTDIEAQDETVTSTESDQDPTAVPITPVTSSTIQDFLDTSSELIDRISEPTILQTAFEAENSQTNSRAVSTPRLEFLRKQKRNAENKLWFAWNQVMGSIKAPIESTEA